MNIGIIGLGNMGIAIAHRLLDAGHTVIGYDPNSTACDNLALMGGTAAPSPEAVCRQTQLIWLMVPVTTVDQILTTILQHLPQHSTIIDGGNSFYKDSIRRAQQCAQQQIDFLDCGTSGGVYGGKHGFCLMVGGTTDAYRKAHSIFEALATAQGMAHVGPSGTGHYVKMVHNGIEYGLLQAYTEGFQLLKEGTYKDQPLDLAAIAKLWNHGSIIRSFILQLTHGILKDDQELTSVVGSIEELGTGQWTLQEAQTSQIPTPALQEALRTRAWSRQTGGNYATKLIALLRHTFGGHPIKKKDVA